MHRRLEKRRASFPFLMSAAALVLGLCLAVTPAFAAVFVTNAPGAVDENATGSFTTEVVRSGGPAICTFELTVNASFASVDTLTPPAGWSATVVGNVITWTATGPCIADGDTLLVNWTADAPGSGGDYANNWDAGGGTATGSFDTHVNEPNFGNSSKSVVDRSGGDVEPGDSLRYTVHVVNSGDMTATGVIANDTLSTDFSAAVVISGGSIIDPGPPIVIGTGPAPLAAGDTTTIVFDAFVAALTPDSTTVLNRAWHISGQTARAPTNTTNSLVINPTDLTTSTKTSNDVNGGVLAPGDTLRYTIAVNNTGGADAGNVTVRDTLDPDVAAVANLGPAVIESAGPPIAIRWDAGTIAWNDADTLVFDAVLAFPLDNGTTILNEALVTSDDTTPFTTAQTSDAVTSAPSFSGSSSKSVVDRSGGDVEQGDSLRYTVHIVNDGNMDATGVVVRDTLSTDIASAVIVSGGSIISAGPPIIIGTGPIALAAGDTATIVFDAFVADPLADGTGISNQASVVSDQTTRQTTNTTNTTVVAPILTTSTKTSNDVNGGVLAPADTLRYTIAVNNTGAGTARNVTVRDTLDTNVAAVANLGPAVIEDAGPPIAIRWDVGTIAGNDADTLVFDAVLAFPIDDGTDVLNEALVTSDEAAPFTTAQTSDAVTSAVDFSTIAKTWADDDGGLIQP
ncbi:MAG: DUF11 domain-containing protein, partial [Gemmatimonadetes bacterium]|nr:DUF11 domain-containing protein [Gemmatimonadota bacterium]